MTGVEERCQLPSGPGWKKGVWCILRWKVTHLATWLCLLWQLVMKNVDNWKWCGLAVY